MSVSAQYELEHNVFNKGTFYKDSELLSGFNVPNDNGTLLVTRGKNGGITSLFNTRAL